MATIDDKYSVSVFVNNVFAKRFFVFGTTTSVGDIETPGNPWLFGATVEARF